MDFKYVRVLPITLVGFTKHEREWRERELGEWTTVSRRRGKAVRSGPSRTDMNKDK